MFFMDMRRIKPGNLLKGQSNEIFDPQFFSLSEPAWATDQWVKYFRILFRFPKIFKCFRSSAQYYTALSQVPRSIILRGVK